MTGVVCRDMTWHDIPTLARVDGTVFDADAWPEATWWAELAERPRRDYVVVEEAGDVVAYGGVDVGGETADVMTLVVAPTGQGRGLGRLVLDELEGRARAGGADRLLLEVRADNGPALSLYASNGFEEVGVRRRYYQPGDVDAVIMRKTLGNNDVDR